MIETKLDSNLMETDLYNVIKSVYDGSVYCGNRPKISKFQHEISFVVVKANNGDDNIVANKRVISSKKKCSIQIWTRSLSDGKKNMTEETRVRNLIINLLPIETGNYQFYYNNDIGDRDMLGFHGKYINLNCQVL